MAGTVALQHAETLATYTIAAAVRPGIPVMYCSRISAIDPRSAISIWGGPDIGLTLATNAFDQLQRLVRRFNTQLVGENLAATLVLSKRCGLLPTVRKHTDDGPVRLFLPRVQRQPLRCMATGVVPSAFQWLVCGIGICSSDGLQISKKGKSLLLHVFQITLR